VTNVGVEERIEWLPSMLRDGVRMGRAGDQIVVEWRGIGRLFASPSGSGGKFVPAAGVDGTLLKKFETTSLMACRRYLAGALSLHGSAVAFAGGAVVFVGDCESGKSTTAMAMVQKHGGTFLADDIVPIDWRGSTPIVSPVDDSFWLARDASSWFGFPTTSDHKQPQPPRARSATSERLRAIVHLVFDESTGTPKFQPVAGHEAFMVLSRAHVCYSAGSDNEILRSLSARARVAGATTVCRLQRPRNLEALRPAVQLLEESLAVGSSPRPA
jgi:hypothetical protein